MSKVLWKSLLIAPVGLAATVAASASTMAAEIQARTEVAQADAPTDLSQVRAIFSANYHQTSTPKAEVQANRLTDPIVVATVEPAVESLALQSQAPVEETSASLTQPSDASSSLDRADSLLAQQMPDAGDTTTNSSGSLEQINRYSNDINESSSDALDQITNVSQLRDVSPGDWAFEALRSLVERYGCIAGYPDGTFRGNRATTRFEFAAGLNACLQQVERLIAASTEGFVTREDLETLQRLVQEFEAELATLGTRVDDLEGRVAFVEDHQFSTTTKLRGEVIFAISDLFGDQDANGNDYEATETVFQDRVRLNLETSFTGEDLLFTRLQAGNVTEFGPVSSNSTTNVTREGRLGFQLDNGNDIALDRLYYRFPVADLATVYLFANGGQFRDFVPLLNPNFVSSGSGSISRFGRYNPIYRMGGAGAGAGVVIGPKSPFRIDLGYLSNTSADPGEDAGIFNGNYSALGQVTFQPSKAFSIAATYVHSYDNDNLRHGTGSLTSQIDTDGPLVSNSYGVQASFAFSPQLVLSGWAGYTDVTVLETGNADVWNYAATLALNDFGTQGSTLGFVVGMEPRLTGSSPLVGSLLGTRRDADTGLHVEGFYKLQVSDNIAITPGVIWLTAPGHNEDNDDIFIGTVRTTFTF